MMRAAEVVEGNFRRFATHCRCNVLQNAFDERSEEHTSELQSRSDLVCRLLLEKKKNNVAGGNTDENKPLAPSGQMQDIGLQRHERVASPRALVAANLKTAETAGTNLIQHIKKMKCS